MSYYRHFISFSTMSQTTEHDPRVMDPPPLTDVNLEHPNSIFRRPNDILDRAIVIDIANNKEEDFLIPIVQRPIYDIAYINQFVEEELCKHGVIRMTGVFTQPGHTIPECLGAIQSRSVPIDARSMMLSDIAQFAIIPALTTQKVTLVDTLPSKAQYDAALRPKKVAVAGFILRFGVDESPFDHLTPAMVSEDELDAVLARRPRWPGASDALRALRKNVQELTGQCKRSLLPYAIFSAMGHVGLTVADALITGMSKKGVLCSLARALAGPNCGRVTENSSKSGCVSISMELAIAMCIALDNGFSIQQEKTTGQKMYVFSASLDELFRVCVYAGITLTRTASTSTKIHGAFHPRGLLHSATGSWSRKNTDKDGVRSIIGRRYLDDCKCWELVLCIQIMEDVFKTPSENNLVGELLFSIGVNWHRLKFVFNLNSKPNFAQVIAQSAAKDKRMLPAFDDEASTTTESSTKRKKANASLSSPSPLSVQLDPADQNRAIIMSGFDDSTKCFRDALDAAIADCNFDTVQAIGVLIEQERARLMNILRNTGASNVTRQPMIRIINALTELNSKRMAFVQKAMPVLPPITAVPTDSSVPVLPPIQYADSIFQGSPIDLDGIVDSPVGDCNSPGGKDPRSASPKDTQECDLLRAKDTVSGNHFLANYVAGNPLTPNTPGMFHLPHPFTPMTPYPLPDFVPPSSVHHADGDNDVPYSLEIIDALIERCGDTEVLAEWKTHLEKCRATAMNIICTVPVPDDFVATVTAIAFSKKLAKASSSMLMLSFLDAHADGGVSVLRDFLARHDVNPHVHSPLINFLEWIAQ